YVQVMTEPFGMCIVALDERELADEHRARVREYKRALDSRIRKMIAAGVKDGSIAPCEPKLTVFILMGSLNWIGRWYDSAGAITREELADSYVQYVRRAIESDASRQQRGME